MTQKIPLSLYIHIPWCVRKCPYCDFNSHTLKKESHEGAYEGRYFDALIADFRENIQLFPSILERPLHSIFIGGGTPSLFKPESYEKLFKAIFQEINQEDNLEITLEANPGTADEQNFQGYKALGINRISLGVQSFNPEKLKKLGRIHSADQAINAFHMARKAGFERINLDLMFGLPDQTIEEALNDIDQAILLNPDHLSWYQLTLEPNTVFYKKPPVLPNEDYLWDMEVAGKKKIKEHYQQYEISAYSKSNQQSRHNLNYWLFGDYLGIGAGAHGKITLVNESDDFNKRVNNSNEHHDGYVKILRTQKNRQPDDYMNPDKKFIAKQEEILPSDIPFEFMLNALRLFQPISYELFFERTNLAINLPMNLSVKLTEINKKLIHAQEKGLVILNEKSFEVTKLGHRYLNDLQEMFLDCS